MEVSTVAWIIALHTGLKPSLVGSVAGPIVDFDPKTAEEVLL